MTNIHRSKTRSSTEHNLNKYRPCLVNSFSEIDDLIHGGDDITESIWRLDHMQSRFQDDELPSAISVANVASLNANDTQLVELSDAILQSDKASPDKVDILNDVLPSSQYDRLTRFHVHAISQLTHFHSDNVQRT